MTRHRLEIFSDSVFAIVLTLLVLDLKVPAARGVAGLWEIAPALLVHAATFFIVGVLWILHHGILARVENVTSRTLRFNLVTLFWITLLPFAAKNAAAHPLEPLGASMMAASCGGYLLSMLAMRLSAHSTIDDNPAMRSWRIYRIVLVSSFVLADILCAAASWLTAWAGYAASLATVVVMVLLPSPPEVEARFERQAS